MRSVGSARRHLREALEGSAAAYALDAAELAVSELVTNAVVHAGTAVVLRIHTSGRALRVEVGDGSPHLPVRRRFATTSGTGRGLHLVDECVDRWDVEVEDDGKVVWFEIGRPEGERLAARPPTAGPTTVEVVLQQVPLLMHAAWQEHAASLLREQLLATLDEDVDALEQHSQASDALNVLAEQLPVPDLAEEPDALMSDATEPRVSAEQISLHVPVATVERFAVLDELLGRAVREAAAGRFLGPPTQPEIDEMRRWLCREVVAQAADGQPPTPWAARVDTRSPLEIDEAVGGLYRELAASDEAVVVTNEASVIVAVTTPLLEALGYADESDIIGRRVLAVVPARFHQAHIAGTTLHVTNGRAPLIGVPVTVPVLRADGTEVPLRLTVEVRRLAPGRQVFLGRFDLSG
ncbi:ATP-binding protein [Nocardioides sp. SYSU DS0663]|uniref:ATP-binding protein n=1 Tax=Nocardioides sp. SYSU DS0663 TaxID=3416445 RepID=UPI003F4C5906